MHLSLSLSLSLLVDPPMECLLKCLQTRFRSRSDPNGIQNRMFRQFKNVCIRQKVRKALHVILWNVRHCRTKADAHDKFGFLVLIGSSCKTTLTLRFDILRNQAKTKDSCANTVQSLSLSLSTFTTCYQSLQTVWV